MLFIKQKSLVLFLLLTCIQTYSQSDSTKHESKVYKNNIQTNLTGFAGYFSLQYERALNKKFSIGLIGSFNHPFINNNFDIKYTYIISTQLRYYFDKNFKPNNGLYVYTGVNYSYGIVFFPNNSISNVDYKYPSAGLGIGKQWIVKKRFVIDIAGALFKTFLAQERHENLNQNWVNSINYNRSYQLFITLNWGYTF